MKAFGALAAPADHPFWTSAEEPQAPLDAPVVLADSEHRNNVGVMREKSGLVQALDHLRETLPRVAVSSPTDLIKLLELQNMRCVAKMVCRTALIRTESRGSHFRSDYPAEDNRIWLKNIVVRKSATGIKLETKPVSLDLVELAV